MVKTVNSDNFPWSIKGVSIEARKLAKEGAAQEGITIGEWLKKIIEIEPSEQKKLRLTTAPDDKRQLINSNAIVVDNGDLGDVLVAIQQTEIKFLGLIQPLHAILNQLSLRIESLEVKVGSNK
jgi:hypothetical protein